MMSVAPPPTALDAVHDGPSIIGEGNDIYASFLSERPLHPTQEAERLKADVLRTKKQLLELALQAEQKAAKGELPAEEAARLRRMRVAERYLYHPERIHEAYSRPGSAAASEEGAPARGEGDASEVP